MSLSRTAWSLLVAGTFWAASAIAQDASSYCDNVPQLNAGTAQAFRMEEGLEAKLFGGQFGRDDLRFLLEASIERMQEGRGRQISIVSTATGVSDCASPLARNCVGAYPPGNAVCITASGILTDVVAKGGCNVTVGCKVTLCPEQLTVGYGTSDLVQILAHEYGHTFGLDHPDAFVAGEDFDTCQTGSVTTSFCPSEGTSPDGCDGELECALSNCALGMSPQQGDILGLRAQYNGGTGSPVRGVSQVIIPDTGAGSIPAAAFIDFAGSSAANDKAVFPPRIDCSKLAGSTNDCLLVQRTNAASPILVTRLRDTSATGGAQWSKFELSPAGLATLFSPDIAINAQGTRAYVAVARSSQRGLVFLLEFDLASGSLLATTSLDGALDSAGQSIRAFAALPPRVAWSPALQAPIVFVYGANAIQPPELFPERPRLRLYSVSSTGTVSAFPPRTTSDADEQFGAVAHRMTGDFDVDCGSDGGSNAGLPTDTCVLAGAIHPGTVNDNNEMRWISFVLRAPAAAETGPKVVSLSALQSSGVQVLGVDSVALKTRGTDGRILPTNPIYAVASRAFAPGSTGNTRVVRGTGVSFASPTTSILTSDHGSCTAQSHEFITFPAFSPRQAFSAAWCQDCGTLEGTTLQAPVDGVCY